MLGSLLGLGFFLFKDQLNSTWVLLEFVIFDLHYSFGRLDLFDSDPKSIFSLVLIPSYGLLDLKESALN